MLKLLAIAALSIYHVLPIAPLEVVKPTTELGSAAIYYAPNPPADLALTNIPPLELSYVVDVATPAKVARPAWECPIQGPVHFINSYGEPRNGHIHIGIDMTVPWGTPIVAPIAGHVTFAADYLGGNAFYLDGVDGMTYYGAHLSRYGKSGDVAMGDIIGYVGMTGDAASPHLHFEMHPGGILRPSINPYGQLLGYCNQV